jgi:hypothetical protein
LFDILLSFHRERSVASGRLLRLLDERVQQDHFARQDAEQHACDPAIADVAPHLQQTLSELSADGHANRPPKLDRGDVCAHDLSVIRAPSSLSQSRTGSLPFLFR